MRGMKYESARFPSSDGTPLTGWWLPANEPSKGTVIHFHGNAQNMSTHVRFADWLPAEGYNLFVFDYRGYGMSGGVPTRRGLTADGVAALEWVASRPEVDSDSLFVWGQSLGGTVALQALARSEIPVRAVLIDSTFYSHTRVAAEKLRELPWFLSWIRLMRPLLFTPGHDAYSALKTLDHPVSFLHGELDPVIPYHHSLLLYETARNPRHLWIIPNAGHCDAVLRHPDIVRPKILGFFQNPDEGVDSVLPP